MRKIIISSAALFGCLIFGSLLTVRVPVKADSDQDRNTFSFRSVILAEFKAASSGAPLGSTADEAMDEALRVSNRLLGLAPDEPFEANQRAYLEMIDRLRGPQSSPNSSEEYRRLFHDEKRKQYERFWNRKFENMSLDEMDAEHQRLLCVKSTGISPDSSMDACTEAVWVRLRQRYGIPGDWDRKRSSIAIHASIEGLPITATEQEILKARGDREAREKKESILCSLTTCGERDPAKVPDKLRRSMTDGARRRAAKMYLLPPDATWDQLVAEYEKAPILELTWIEWAKFKWQGRLLR